MYRTFVSSILVAIATTCSAQDYDIVITNGRIIDPETGLDAIRNLGINGGEIYAISEFAMDGSVEIDANDLVVALGFIDLHAHGMNLGDMRMQAMQGVTTVLELESGILPIADWYAEMERQQTPLNYGASAAWTFGRIAAFTGEGPVAELSYFQNAQRFDDWK
ncbi:amidohydrolase family protein [Ruegeria sp. 6PALISEP08]|uniref:amidohydrolase family protein n=1 Tax=Ruegeria sp. 6PALISEP08 TaxID=1225660 RepID=UPI00067E7327|nr:amidohydrolase family protein [Ruegeria sp. 6PALISEP08]